MEGGIISSHVTREALVSAARSNMVEFFRYWGSSRLITAHDSREISWMDSDVEFSLFNQVYETRLEPDTADDRIEEVLSHFASRGLTLEWPVLPGCNPDDLAARLQAHGLVFEGDRPALVVNLAQLTRPSATVKGLTIRKVKRNDLTAFMEATGRAFDASARDQMRFTDVLKSLGVGGKSRYECYLGTLSGKPVATALLFRAAGVAGVYWVGTVPETRGLGIGTQMTLKPLLDAREDGFEIGTLQATHMGEPVYRRIGFNDCFRFMTFLQKPIPKGGNQISSQKES